VYWLGAIHVMVADKASVVVTGNMVVTRNVALALPPGTVTVAGTVADEGLLLDSDTTAPPLGAGPLSVTVPVEPLPPTTEDGLKDRETSATGGGSTGGSTIRGED